MDLIADTNVWYDIGAGRRDPRILKSGGSRLVATPVSILEIASSIDQRKLASRQEAAKAILDHADEIVLDPSSHLASIWGLHIPDPHAPWRDACKAIVQASTVSELQQGVVDLIDGVCRGVNVPVGKAWRNYEYKGFKNKVVNAIDKVVNAIDQEAPSYKDAIRQGKVKHPKKATARKIAEALRSPENRQLFVVITFYRALQDAGQTSREPTREEYERAEPSVSPYVDACTEYLIGCVKTLLLGSMTSVIRNAFCISKRTGHFFQETGDGWILPRRSAQIISAIRKVKYNDAQCFAKLRQVGKW